MPWQKGVPLRPVLTDDDLEAIALAMASGTPMTRVAAQLGKPYFTVNAAARRLRQLGGWPCCPLDWRTCTECGEPLAMPQRTAHPDCEAARQARYSRDRRAARAPGSLSTPYIARWRAENPDRDHELREQDKARRREQWPELPPERRAELLGRAHEYDADAYQETVATANQRGEDWTEEEDAYVWEHLHDPARDVALHLGRTLWAVRHRRVKLRRQHAAAEDKGRSL